MKIVCKCGHEASIIRNYRKSFLGIAFPYPKAFGFTFKSKCGVNFSKFMISCDNCGRNNLWEF